MNPDTGFELRKLEGGHSKAFNAPTSDLNSAHVVAVSERQTWGPRTVRLLNASLMGNTFLVIPPVCCMVFFICAAGIYLVTLKLIGVFNHVDRDQLQPYFRGGEAFIYTAVGCGLCALSIASCVLIQRVFLKAMFVCGFLKRNDYSSITAIEN